MLVKILNFQKKFNVQMGHIPPQLVEKIPIPVKIYAQI